MLRNSKEEGVAGAAPTKGSRAEAEVRGVCWGHIMQWFVGHRDDFDFDSQERWGPREGPEGGRSNMSDLTHSVGETEAQNSYPIYQNRR